MAAIIVSGRWRRQPAYAVTVDNTNPIARGIVFAGDQFGRDVVTGRKMTTGPGSNVIVPGHMGKYDSGLVYKAAPGSGQGGWIHTLDNPITNSTATLGALYYGGAYDSSSLFSLNRADSTTGYIGFVLSGPRPFARSKSASSGSSAYAEVTTAGVWQAHVAIFNGTSNRRKVSPGEPVHSDTATISPGDLSRVVVGNYYESGSLFWAAAGVGIACPILWDRALSDDEALAYGREPWALFKKKPTILYFPSAGGGGATGTGTLTAQSSTVAGTATRTITGTGTPSAQASTVSGTAEREITSSGTPTAQSSTVSGSGSVSAGISGSGTLLSQSSTVAGTAEREVTGTGTPTAQSATVAGTAAREITSSGTPTAQASTVSGTGQVGNIITGTGNPTAQSATVAGTAERSVTGTGTPSAQSATVAGTSVRTITGSGTLAANDSTVSGYDVAPAPSLDTGGGGSRRVLLRERKVREEVDEWLAKKAEQDLLKKIQREDEELILIMALVA